MRNVLMIATVATTIAAFNMDNIQILQNMGYTVHVAANFDAANPVDIGRLETIKNEFIAKRVVLHQIDFTRNPFVINQHIKAYRQLVAVMKDSRFDFIHCHTPIASAIARLAAYKVKIRVIYTAHGFHFYRGAPFINWLLYYPMEWILSYMTDVLITINTEDYGRAKKHLHAKKVEYVPGVGIDTQKFNSGLVNRTSKRNEIGLNIDMYGGGYKRLVGRYKLMTDLHIPFDSILLLSVGELNANKNHAVVIKALRQLKNVHYLIAGQGELYDELECLAKKNNVNLHLLGYRTDIANLLTYVDCFLLPSIREGLNVSLMEAMASGLPCICSDIRGNRDLISNGIGGFLASFKSVSDWGKKIRLVCFGNALKNANIVNREKIKKFSTNVVNKAMKKIYTHLS